MPSRESELPSADLGNLLMSEGPQDQRRPADDAGDCVAVQYDSWLRLLAVLMGLCLPARTPQRRNKRIGQRPTIGAVSRRSWWRRTPTNLPPLNL